MAFVSKEVHGEDLWRLSGGGVAGWLADWLACWLACLLLPMAQRTRSIAEAQDRARLGRGCGGMYLYAGGRARRARQDQIWLRPDLAAMQCHGMPRQAMAGLTRRAGGEAWANVPLPDPPQGSEPCVSGTRGGAAHGLRRWALGLSQQDVDGGCYSVYICSVSQCASVPGCRAG